MLGHLLALLVQNELRHDDAFIRRFVEQQNGDGQEGIKPAAGLVHRLGDEIGREKLLKFLLVFKWIVPLRHRHRPGIEPYVDYLRRAAHFFSAIGAGKLDCIDIRAVQVEIFQFLSRQLAQFRQRFN